MNKHKILCVGGGHGLSTILYAIKDFTYITGIVAVTDTGGSTGKIRSKFDCPAIGDLRICLNALSNNQLREIFERRIRDYGDCVGNLIIASLIKLYDFDTAIKIMHKLLGLKETHRIIPVSLDNFNICGTYRNKKEIKKETDFIEENKIEEVNLSPVPKANAEAIEAIQQSDYIIISPGSFFTSILANLLIPEIAKEINKKCVIWIVNAMQQYGETIGMNTEDHADYLLKYINHIDYAIVNNIKPSDNDLKQYESYLIPLVNLNERANIKHIIFTDLIKNSPNGIVHSPYKVSKILKEILNEK
jgi:uncharacterized cofD-like protein